MKSLLLNLSLFCMASASPAAEHIINVESIYYSSAFDGHMRLVESEIIQQAGVVCGNNLDSIRIKSIAIKVLRSEVTSDVGVGEIKVSQATSTQPALPYVELNYPNVKIEATVSCP